MKLTRDSITQERIDEIAAEMERTGAYRVLSNEAREASRQATLDRRPDDEAVWIFGYGSLMWNPAFHFAEAAHAKLYGYHRHFCLWTPLGRGSPDHPGLVLGLERGGSCHGMAFRLREHEIDAETRIVWMREMLGGAYLPRWVRLRIGGARANAIAFVVNHEHERYAGRLPLGETARAVATASGRLGSCRDYFTNTFDHLEALGIHDRYMRGLARAVAALG